MLAVAPGSQVFGATGVGSLEQVEQAGMSY
jgi:hypothetical protein